MPIEKIRDMVAFAVPLRIIARPERLIIEDYRPTWMMLLAGGGFLVFAVLFVSFLVGTVIGADSFGLWAMLIMSLVCLAGAVRGTIREVYVFDRTAGSYAFVRQFIHRKEVIEGALTQFTGARVETHTHEDSKSYTVVLRQEGMFLTGVSEQTLRDEIPILNSFHNEASIANAIDEFLHRKVQGA